MRDADADGMTDSLPRSQQRPPDGDEADDPGWGVRPLDDAHRADEEPASAGQSEQPGLPDEPISPAEGGD